MKICKNSVCVYNSICQREKKNPASIGSDITPIKNTLLFPYSVENIQTGQTLGHFYLDPYIRDDKAYAGADKGWYFPLKNRSKFGPTSVLGKFDITFGESISRNFLVV